MSVPVISGFYDKYAFLSNFYIEPDGTHVEGEYQRAKCAEAQDRKQFLDILGKPLPPKECKFIGRRVKLRPDWDEVKVEIMTFYVTKKFRDHPQLAQMLRDTEPCYLEESNMWGDRFWGVVYNSQGIGRPQKRRGLNMLGEILMMVRDEL